MKKNYQLDFYKLLLAISIFYLHTVITFLQMDNPLRRVTYGWGNITVHFFFVISGALMVNNYMRKRSNGYENSIDKEGEASFFYVIGKYKNLFLIYIINFLICLLIEFAVRIYNNGISGIGDCVMIFIESIPEVFAIEMFGIRPLAINNATWYVSAMLISMLILYYFLQKNTDFYLYIFSPVAFFSILAFYYNGGGIFENQNRFHLLITSGVIRAFCGMCGGSLVFIISEAIKKRADLQKGKNYGATFLNILLFLLLVVLYFLPSDYKTKEILYPIIIINSALFGVVLSEASILNKMYNNSIAAHYGKASVLIYFTHTASTKIIKNFIDYQSHSVKFIFCAMGGGNDNNYYDNFVC